MKKMQTQKKGKLIFILMVLLFISPMIAATGHDNEGQKTDDETLPVPNGNLNVFHNCINGNTR